MIDVQAINEFARMIYGERKFILTPYAYPIAFGTLAASSQATQSLGITANADFILTRVRYTAFAAATGAAPTAINVFIPNVSVLITDQGSNEQYSSAAVPLQSFGANSQAVDDLPYPRFIAGRTSLTFQATNNDSAGSAYQLSLVLVGVLARQLS